MAMSLVSKVLSYINASSNAGRETELRVRLTDQSTIVGTFVNKHESDTPRKLILVLADSSDPTVTHFIDDEAIVCITVKFK